MGETPKERRERRREALESCLKSAKDDIKRLVIEARVYRRALFELDREEEKCSATNSP